MSDGSHGRSWNRVLLKLSGEAFAGGEGMGVDPETVRAVADEIASVAQQGIQVAVVVGGGNFFRGAQLTEKGMDRPRADYMGMLGTAMNALALQDFLEKAGAETRVQSAITMTQISEPYIPRRAIRHLEKGRVVIFAAGLGNPYFSTDTTAAQRALEIGAEAMLMAKNGTDGVYDSDPRKNTDAKRYESLTYQTLLDDRLKVADATAISLCMDNALPILVFDMNVSGNITKAVSGEKIGTYIGDSRE